MPLYAYKCSKCGAEEEHIERFSDPPKAVCDTCGGPIARMLTPTAFHLKGGGWYKDGYGSSRPSSDTGASSSSSGASSSTGDSGSAGSSAGSSTPSTTSGGTTGSSGKGGASAG